MIINKNDISSSTIEYINVFDLQKKHISIPIFQRLYEWKKATSSALINDIIDLTYNKEKQLYLLDFISYVEDGVLKLADGQQRIITLNILIKVINDQIYELGLDIPTVDLFDVSYDIDDFDMKYKNCFVNGVVAPPFKEVYLYFRDEFIIPNKDRINDIIYVLKNCIFIYHKVCKTPDDAYAIFTQINMGGKGLTKDDVMKTSINQFSKVYGVPFQCKNKLLKEAITSYYKFVTSDTAGNFDNLTLLTFIKKHITASLDDFVRFTQIYRNIENKKSNPFYSIFTFIVRPTLGDVLNVLLFKGIDVLKNNEYKEKVIIPLCLISINMSLTKSTPTDMRYLISDVLNMIKTDKKVGEISAFIGQYIGEHSSIKLTVDQFSAFIGSQETKEGIKKSILLLDIIYRSSSSIIDIEKINLEHIYPKKPKDWTEKGWPELEDQQKRLIHNIGNYLILNESVNKAIQNKYIDKKIPEYLIIIEKDKNLKTEMNTVDFERFKTEKGSYIAERQRYIAEQTRELPFGANLIVK